MTVAKNAHEPRKNLSGKKFKKIFLPPQESKKAHCEVDLMAREYSTSSVLFCRKLCAQLKAIVKEQRALIKSLKSREENFRDKLSVMTSG